MSSKNKWEKILGCTFLLIALAMSARGQDARFTNNQYNVAFQPPPGWVPTILVQYEGPQRQEGMHPALNLTAVESLTDVSEQGANKLADDFVAEFTGEGFEDAKILGRRKLTIAGLEALQIDLSFGAGESPIQIRRVFIPAKQQNRTYIFTLSDRADRFGESAPLADAAIASFSFPQTAGAAAGTTPAGAKAPASSLLLILLGVLALAVVVGIAYLLSRKRPESEAGSSQ